MLGLCAPLPSLADEAALYERFDELSSRALGQLPPAANMRRDGYLAWFANAAEAEDLAGLRLRLLDANDAVIVEYSVGPDGVADGFQALGQHAHPGAGEYIVETRVPGEGQGNVRQRLALTLRGDEQIIRLRAPGDSLRTREPQLRIWAGEGGAGIATRFLDWLGVGEGATRLALREDLMEAPDVRDAQRLCRDDEQALDGLHRLRRIAGAFQTPPAGIELAQARCALQLGLRAVAAEALLAVGEREVPRGKLIAAAIDLAALDLERGDADRAIDVLRALEPMIEPRAYPRFLDRLSLALLQRGDTVAAGEALADGPHLSVAQIWDEDGAAEPVLAFMLLNHAVTLEAAGEHGQALSVFDIAGQRDTRGPVGQALRDRANLILGNELLQRKQGSEAAAVFDRINLDGPRAEAALLGRGWAVLQGPSAPMRRERVSALSRAGMSETALHAMFKTGVIGCFELQHFTRDVGSCSGSTRFERAPLEEEDARAPEAAMRFWGPLMARDARDPNVLRAFLAAADAFRVVGNAERAEGILDEGLEQLEAVQSRLNAASARLSEEGVPDPGQPLDADAPLPARDLRYWLLDWASSAGAARMAESRRLLLRLAERSGGGEEAESLRELADAMSAQRKSAAAEALEARGETLRELRAEARLMLARLFDRPAP